MVAEAAVAMVLAGGDAEPSSTTTTSLFCVASPVVRDPSVHSDLRKEKQPE
jgi:hypothetical protein